MPNTNALFSSPVSGLSSETLDYASINVHATGANGTSVQAIVGNTTGANLTVVPGSAGRVAFSAAGGLINVPIIRQNVSGVAVGNNALTIAKAGRYKVGFGITYTMSSANVHNALYIVKNGATILGAKHSLGDNASYISDFIEVEATLAVGDTLDFRISNASNGGGNITSHFVNVEQLPTATLVDPGTVPVETLHRASLRFDGTTAFTFNATSASGQTQTFPFASAVLDLNIGGIVNVAGNQIVITQTGDYRITYSPGMTDATDSRPIVKLNGVAISTTNPWVSVQGDQITAELLVRLVVGDVLTFHEGNQPNTNHRGLFLVVEQLPTATVVDPGAVTVNDQAASGYMDIGTMRMQWGRDTNTGASRTVVLPAPFANNNYRVQLTADQIGAAIATIDTGSKTTTQFSFGVRNTSNATENSSTEWFAIGLKP